MTGARYSSNTFEALLNARSGSHCIAPPSLSETEVLKSKQQRLKDLLEPKYLP